MLGPSYGEPGGMDFDGNSTEHEVVVSEYLNQTASRIISVELSPK